MQRDDKIYIERQKNYTNQRGTFGPLGNISANGCGAIAVYNVLTHFGIQIDFMAIVKRFNRQWLFATSFGGFMGSYIFYLAHILKKYHLQVRPVIFTSRVLRRFHLDDKSALILFYGWRKGRKLGAHYQAGFGHADGSITLHNPNVTYFGIHDMLKEKRKKEHMWMCMGLMVRKGNRDLVE